MSLIKKELLKFLYDLVFQRGNSEMLGPYYYISIKNNLPLPDEVVAEGKKSYFGASGIIEYILNDISLTELQSAESEEKKQAGLSGPDAGPERQWKEEGKIEGLAYGILALFMQDAIKKPFETITNGHLLNLPNDINELDLIADLVDQYKNEEPKAIKLLTNYLQGEREVVVANLIYDRYLQWEKEDLPEFLNISNKKAEEIWTKNEEFVNDIVSILLSASDNDNSEILPSADLPDIEDF